jgi:hypothetical protein
MKQYVSGSGNSVGRESVEPGADTKWRLLDGNENVTIC